MRKPITLRPLTDEEQPALHAGRRSPQSCPGRRCPIRLASQRGGHAREIAEQLSCGDQTVRKVIHAFHRHGLVALQPQSQAPHRLPQAVCDAVRREPVPALLPHRPRQFGHPTSVWTLPLAAQVA